MNNFKDSTEVCKYITEVFDKLEADTPIARLLNHKFKEIEEKLPSDMKQLSVQYLYMFGLMLEEAETNPEFELQMLLPYKTWNRLYKFMDNRARPQSKVDKNFRPRCAMVDSITLLSWIRDYYSLDDREDYEKEVKAKEEAERKRTELDEKIKNRKVSTSNENSTTVSVNLSKVENKENKISKRDCNGQLDFFSMLQDNEE